MGRSCHHRLPLRLVGAGWLSDLITADWWTVLVIIMVVAYASVVTSAGATIVMSVASAMPVLKP